MYKIHKPTYASGAIGRGVEARGAFAEVTADCVCTFPAITDSRNGAALVDICNIKEFLLSGGWDKKFQGYKEADVLVKSSPKKHLSASIKSCPEKSLFRQMLPTVCQIQERRQINPPPLEPNANRLGAYLYSKYIYFESLLSLSMYILYYIKLLCYLFYIPQHFLNLFSIRYFNPSEEALWPEHWLGICDLW